MKFICYVALLNILILSITVIPSHAEKQQVMPESETVKESLEKQEIIDDSWFSNGKALGKWWIKNPKKFDPVPRPLLYHFEGSYSFSQLNGNVDYKSQTISTDLTLRKKFFTSNTMFDVKKNEITMSLFPDNTTKVETNYFQQYFAFSLTNRFSVIGGYMWETNDSAKYVKDSKVRLGGLVVRLFESPKFTVRVVGAYATLKTIYMNDSLVEIPGFIPVEPYETGSLYFFPSIDWQITNIISFNNMFTYLYCFEGASYHKWGIDFKLKFKVTETISFFTNYNIGYDNNPFVESVNQSLDNANSSGKLNKKDTELSIGINIAI